VRITTFLFLTTTPQAGRSRALFPMVSLQFFIELLLSAALWPWPWRRLNLYRKWVPAILRGVTKGDRWVVLSNLVTYLLHGAESFLRS